MPVATGARVVVFSAPPLLEPVADSNGGTSRDIENDPIAQRPRRSRRIVGGYRHPRRREPSPRRPGRHPRRPGRAARPPRCTTTSPPSQVVRRRMLVAGGIAAAFAIGFGYALATLFARRIRRLEAAAERIAGGRFDETGGRPAPDELGQLARAFERMRLRLASLDRARGEFIANAFARAADAAVLARRIPRAARRRGDRRAPPGRVPRGDARPAEPPDEARHRSARSVADRRGAARSRRRQLDLDAVAGSLAVESAPGPAAAAHELEVESERWVPARGDEERVRQIVRILLENAIVHTPSGTTVTISPARPADGRRSPSPTTARASPDRPDARLRALLSARRDDCVRQRPRPRDRARARRADGRPDRAGVAARVDPLHARACDGRRQAARAARGPSGVRPTSRSVVGVTTGRARAVPRSSGAEFVRRASRRRFGRPLPAGKLS